MSLRPHLTDISLKTTRYDVLFLLPISNPQFVSIHLLRQLVKCSQGAILKVLHGCVKWWRVASGDKQARALAN